VRRGAPCLPWVLACSQPPPLSEQKDTGSLVMVNFYTDFVSCTKEASLSQVAGRWVVTLWWPRGGGLAYEIYTCHSPQTTWITSRRWQAPGPWALEGTMMVLRGKCETLSCDELRGCDLINVLREWRGEEDVLSLRTSWYKPALLASGCPGSGLTHPLGLGTGSLWDWRMSPSTQT
jgi:hypothetical protein